jgi:hypothetical protein
MLVVDQLPPPGLNQMVKLLNHLFLIEKIIRVENRGADIHL